MKKHFYSHLVNTTTLVLALGDMDMPQEERKQLITLAEENLHLAVLDAILSELSDDDKRTFMEHVAHDEHDKVWELLDKKVDTIEDKIQKAAEEVKKELHKDIEEVHEETE